MTGYGQRFIFSFAEGVHAGEGRARNPARVRGWIMRIWERGKPVCKSGALPAVAKLPGRFNPAFDCKSEHMCYNKNIEQMFLYGKSGR